MRSVLAMRMIGRGRAGLEAFCAFMNMLPPVSSPAYSSINSQILEFSLLEAKASFLSASHHLHSLHGASPDEIIDVTVTCDGSWSKRGFTAMYGVVAVIAWESGQVLDVEALSKHCTVCSRQLQIDEQSQEFTDWWEGHQHSCGANYSGSSPAMEAEGALRIWKRSVELLKLRYTTVISDGDSKTIKMLNDHKPYGEGITIEKHECVGHVQKRMGKQLRELKSKTKVCTYEIPRVVVTVCICSFS